MPRLLPLLTAALTVAVAGCAPNTQTAPVGTTGASPACFYQDEVTRFRTGHDQTLYVRAVGADVFELKASGHCRNLDDADVLAFDPVPGPPLRLCVGDHARLTVAAAMSPATPCQVEVVRRLTAEQVAALPDRDRP